MDREQILRVGWDTSLLLRYITGAEAERANLVRDLLHYAHMPESSLVIVMSPLVRAEIFSRPENDPEKLALVDRLFFGVTRPGRSVHIRPLTIPIAMRAAEIAATYEKVTTPDAIHLATALEFGATHFWTYDGDRDRKRNRSGGLIGLSGQIDGLVIEPPYLPAGAQRTLLDLNTIERRPAE